MEAEREIQALIAEAAKTGQYDVLQDLARLGNGVASMLAGRHSTWKDLMTSDQPRVDLPGPSFIEGKGSSANRHRGQDGNPTSLRRGRNGETYPRFIREGQTLVKIGWSQSKGAEYEHRAPYETLEGVVLKIREIASRDRQFQVQQLAEVVLPSTKQPVPNYQIYLALAWLRHLGFVQQNGRQGYCLSGNHQILESVRDAWSKMASV